MDIIIDTGCMPIIVQLIRTHLTIHDSGKVTGNAELVDPALKILDQFCRYVSLPPSLLFFSLLGASIRCCHCCISTP